MKGLKITKTKLKALILENKKSNKFTVFLEGLGGPIISGNDLDTAKKDFADALGLSIAVRNLNYYTQAVKASDKEKEQYLNEFEAGAPEIEYTNIPMSC